MASNFKITTLWGGFEQIHGYEPRKGIRKKGEEMVYHAFNVREVQKSDITTGEVTSIDIIGDCIREMSLTEKPWIVTLEVEPRTRDIKRSHCSCTAGADGVCKHTAAIYKYVNSERSEGCTDAEQSWSKPSKKLAELYPKGECIQKLFFGKERTCRDYSGQAIDTDKLTSALKKHSLQNSSVYKSLTIDTAKSSHSPAEIENIDTVPDSLKTMLEAPLGIDLKTSPESTVSIFAHHCRLGYQPSAFSINFRRL